MTLKIASDVTAPSRAVILGAGGFLSPVLKQALETTGIRTRAIGSAEVDLTLPDATSRLSDLLLTEDVIVMTAGLTPDKGRDVATMMANLRMAETVSAAIHRVKPAQFVYVSSDGVYDGRSSSLVNESSSCEPTDLYAAMHVTREKVFDQACSTAKVPYAIIRPCAIYGPGDTHNSYGPNRFLRTAIEDQTITLFGNGEEKRHHVFVADVAELIRLCVVHRAAGIINAVTGSAISFVEVAEQIAAGVDRKVTIKRLPRTSAITHRHFDVSNLARTFPGFRATPFADGVTRTILQAKEALCLR